METRNTGAHSTGKDRGAVEAPKTPAQMYAMIAGAFLTALGVLSLIIVGLQFGNVADVVPNDFLIWEATGWTTVMWIATGVLGLLMMGRIDSARTYAIAAGIFFTAIAVWGFIDGDDVFNIFAAGTTNNITHAILGGLGLLTGLPTQRQQRNAGIGTSKHEEDADERRFERDRLAAPERTETRRPGARL